MARVFVGNLPEGVRERDLSEKFDVFGRVSSIRIKFPARPPPFAFIEYENERDASDAVQGMHGRSMGDCRLRVEISRGGSGVTDTARPRGTQYRVAVSGLPDSMSWQDLKDFLRDGGDVVHSDVDRRGNGTASFVTPDEMRRAIRKLDGAELAGERVRIREEGAGGRSLSPSRSRSPRRTTRPRSPSRSRSRSRSPRRATRQRSPSRSRSRSGSRSRSTQYRNSRSHRRSRSH